MDDCGDKELKFKIFKLELTNLSNIIDKKMFEQIFGHTFETLANKPINTTNKEENQIILNNINENKEKLTKKMKRVLVMIMWSQTSDRRNNLIDAINAILDFNEKILLDLTWKYKN